VYRLSRACSLRRRTGPKRWLRSARMALAASTLALLDYVWPRVRGRLDGIADEEYLWEPAPTCWSVRRAEGGTWEADFADAAPEPPPVTTIAWRTWHIGSECLGGFAQLLFGEHPLSLGSHEWYPTASSALEALDRAWSGFAAGCHQLDDEQMAVKLGPDWGQWAESNKADALLHVADEVIHHGAEVALLRDLYAAIADRSLSELPPAGPDRSA
jgi:hypothetical protein